LCATHGIENLSVLHSDIQGAEFDMLEGGVKMLSNHAVDFVFVSTHSELLHSTVKNKLIEWGYIALADVSPIQSYSDDGILVVRSPKINFKMDFEVSMRDALR
jgi:hypothetical protein